MLRNYSKGEKGCEAKEEGIILSSNNSDDHGKYSFPKAATTNSSRSQWSGFRNPRIVRVSRSFGGKDRHSKVCTIRGLRDRRIRLSVPTAIQLYDLQDKLRLGQPSKVIDWLLDVTKLDIDKLPPLQIPTGFSQFHQQMLFPQYDHHYYSTSSSSSQFCSSLPPPPPPTFALDTKGDSSTTTMEKTAKLWDMDLALLQEKASSATKGKWVIDNNGSNNQQVEDYNEQISAQKQLVSMANNNRSSLPNMIINNNSTPFNYNTTASDQPASCLSLSQFGNLNNNNNNNNGVFPPQVEAQTSSSSSSHASALFFTPYASYITNPFESHIHFLTSNSHAFSNNPFNMPSALHPFASQNLKPFPPANFNNLKQLLHADNNGAPGSAKDGATAGNS